MTELDPDDPERLLSLSYAPARVREGLAALWCLDERLGAAIVRAEQPALAQMRLTWWHDALADLATVGQVDPVLVALARTPGIDGRSLLALFDAWDILLEPLPLSDDALAAFAEARGATLFRAAGRLLGTENPAVEEAGRLWALVDLAFGVSDRETAARALALAPVVRARLPRPLAVLAALAARDKARGLRDRRQGSPGRVARALLAGLTGR